MNQTEQIREECWGQRLSAFPYQGSGRDEFRSLVRPGLLLGAVGAVFGYDHAIVEGSYFALEGTNRMVVAAVGLSIAEIAAQFGRRRRFTR